MYYSAPIGAPVRSRRIHEGPVGAPVGPHVLSTRAPGIVAHRHDQVSEPVCEHVRPVLQGTEMRVHPSDPVGAYS